MSNEATAGPELDARVAERVMGLVACGAWEPIRVYPVEYMKTGLCNHPACAPSVYVARFSTDIAAAWQVVEKLRADGWSFACIGDGKTWTSVFAREVPEIVEPDTVEADTAPLAICLAALAAAEAR